MTEPKRTRKRKVDPIVADAEQAPAPEPEVSDGSHTLAITPRLLPLFESKHRYIVLRGGRASSKSWTVAIYILTRCMAARERVLCLRETQSSIADSNYRLLCDTVRRLGVEDDWNILNDTLTCKSTGSEIIFAGLRDHGNRIRSLEGATLAHVEESQQISKKSLEALTPTIRAPGSQILFSMNPDLESDAVYKMFCKTPRDDALVLECNYVDNPFCSEDIRAEAEYCRQSSEEDYQHVWMGQCRTHAAACILAGKFEIEAFDPAVVASMPGSKVLYGLDFTSGGASPQAAIRSIMTNDGDLFITHESYVAGVAADEMGAVLKRDLPAEIRYAKIWCDSAAPASIAMLVRDGYRAEAVSKWGGSVDDGIRWLRALRRIVIHPSCKRFAEECRLWSWKVDARSGEVLNDPRAGNDHGLDAVRYALMGSGYISREVTTSRATWERIAQYRFDSNLERTPIAERDTAEGDIRRAETAYLEGAIVIGQPEPTETESEQERLARLEKERQQSNQRRLGQLFGLPGASEAKAHPQSKMGAALGVNPGPRPGDRPASEDDGATIGVWFVDAHGNRYRRNAPVVAAPVVTQQPVPDVVRNTIDLAQREGFSIEACGMQLRIRSTGADPSHAPSYALTGALQRHKAALIHHLNR